MQKAIINGVEYRIRGADISMETMGALDVGMSNTWTVYRDGTDKIGYGILISLGVKYGYRLILRDCYGKQQKTDLTKEQVTIITE